MIIRIDKSCLNKQHGWMISREYYTKLNDEWESLNVTKQWAKIIMAYIKKQKDTPYICWRLGQKIFRSWPNHRSGSGVTGYICWRATVFLNRHLAGQILKQNEIKIKMLSNTIIGCWFWNPAVGQVGRSDLAHDPPVNNHWHRWRLSPLWPQT